MKKNDLEIVILAAGKGKRMHSQMPKVLYPIGGKALLEHIVLTTQQIAVGTSPFVVIGHKGKEIQQACAHLNVKWVFQKGQQGTGHALQQVLPFLTKTQRVLVLHSDVPLISTKTLNTLLKDTPINALGMITACFPDPNGLGRILRNKKGEIVGIVEEKDASQKQRKINEINAGIYLIPIKFINKWLSQLLNINAQSEYYLTDIIAMAVKDKISIYSYRVPVWEEVLGVNDCVQLAYLERYFQKQYSHKLMTQGVIFQDPTRFDIRGELSVGHDVFIDINVIIEGQVKIGNHCKIGPNTQLRNVSIGNHVEIKGNCFLDGAEIKNLCVVGPFTRIRPGTVLSSHCHIGNFVEIKNSIIGNYTKINHLSYIGDSEVGKQVNIGAGTITCNYDGVNKYQTIIGDHAFIGSDSQLIAPVKIGEGATIGAGSTITHDAPPRQLTLARVQQFTIENWQRPKKKK